MAENETMTESQSATDAATYSAEPRTVETGTAQLRCEIKRR